MKKKLNHTSIHQAAANATTQDPQAPNLHELKSQVAGDVPRHLGVCASADEDHVLEVKF